MPITEEENAKIQEELDKQIEDQNPVEEPEEAKPEEEETEIEDTEEQPKPYWELRGFKSESEFIKSFENAQSMIGKQATEIGELRKVKPTPEKEEEAPEFDPYDKDNLETHVERKVREALEKAQREREASDSAAKAEEARLKMVGKFIEAHKDELDQAKLESVAIYARDNGIRDLEDAYIVMNAKKPRSEEKKSESTKAKDINDLPNTLSDVGAAGKKDTSAETMTQAEYDALPDEKKEELKRNA